MGIIFDLLKDWHKHPVFNLLLAVCFVSFVAFSFNYFAVAEDAEENKKMLVLIQATIQRNALEAKVYSIEDEIFSLERLVSSSEARERDHERLARLRSDLGSAGRELRRLDNIHSGLID